MFIHLIYKNGLILFLLNPNYFDIVVVGSVVDRLMASVIVDVLDLIHFAHLEVGFMDTPLLRLLW